MIKDYHVGKNNLSNQYERLLMMMVLMIKILKHAKYIVDKRTKKNKKSLNNVQDNSQGYYGQAYFPLP